MVKGEIVSLKNWEVRVALAREGNEVEMSATVNGFLKLSKRFPCRAGSLALTATSACVVIGVLSPGRGGEDLVIEVADL